MLLGNLPANHAELQKLRGVTGIDCHGLTASQRQQAPPYERATPAKASTTAHAAHLNSNTARWEP